MDISINTQSSIRIESEGKVIRFDPYCIDAEKHDADIIFITHDHYDHYSPEDLKKVAKEDTVYVIPKSLEDKITGPNVIVMLPGEKKEACGLSFETIPAYNMKKEHHKKEYGWLGYIVEIENQKLYIAGDTDMTPENSSIKCDICFVPIGGTYTMEAPEAAELVNTIRPKVAVPYHYGSIVGSVKDRELFEEKVDKTIQVLRFLK